MKYATLSASLCPMFFRNIIKPFRKSLLLVLFFILLGGFLSIWWKWNNIDNILGNHGFRHMLVDVILSVITIIALPLLIVGIIHRIMLFGNASSQSSNFFASAGGIISVIISGSTCCGVTLASMLGFLPILTFLPGSGLELKGLGVILLLYGVYDLYSNLEICKTRSH